MNLHDFRPNEPTQLAVLRQWLAGGGAKVALPSALPEHLLISIVRDLRLLQTAKYGAKPTLSLTAPLILVIQLLAGEAKDNPEVTISQSDLYDALQVYHWAAQREIIRRIVGGDALEDDAILLEKIEQARMASK